MGKKFVSLALTMLVLAALTFSTALAQSGDDDVLITPWQQDEITVSTDDELTLATGWAACTRGLVQAFITAIHYEWSLDGDPILWHEDTAQYFGPIERRGAVDWCIAGNGVSWGSSFRYRLGTLPQGTYEFRLVSWLDHPVIDGGDWDGDGHPDLFKGVFADNSVTVYVVDAP